jgi:DNA-binding XRE family transcriptional regulator
MPAPRQEDEIICDGRARTGGHKNTESPAADLKREVFGRNVARMRARAALTQEQLAEKADIDRSQVQRIENGTSSPTVETATRLKRSLRCSWKELLAGLD